jgi:hypothetical protein
MIIPQLPAATRLVVLRPRHDRATPPRQSHAQSHIESHRKPPQGVKTAHSLTHSASAPHPQSHWNLQFSISNLQFEIQQSGSAVRASRFCIIAFILSIHVKTSV